MGSPHACHERRLLRLRLRLPDKPRPLNGWYRKEASKPYWQEISAGAHPWYPGRQDLHVYLRYRRGNGGGRWHGRIGHRGYNNIVVSSQTVTLDVTHTYSIADSASTYSATRRRVNYLNAGLLRFFRPVAAENESGLKPDEENTTDSGSATGGTTDNGNAIDATTDGGTSASWRERCHRLCKGGLHVGLPQTGDTAPGMGTWPCRLGWHFDLVAALAAPPPFQGPRLATWGPAAGDKGLHP